jgi:hypothetical protein
MLPAFVGFYFLPVRCYSFAPVLPAGFVSFCHNLYLLISIDILMVACFNLRKRFFNLPRHLKQHIASTMRINVMKAVLESPNTFSKCERRRYLSKLSLPAAESGWKTGCYGHCQQGNRMRKCKGLGVQIHPFRCRASV